MSEVKEEGEFPSGKQSSWLSRLNPIKLRRPPPIPDERVESPEHKAGLVSVITWHWINHLMFVCIFFSLVVSLSGPVHRGAIGINVLTDDTGRISEAIRGE